MAIPRGHLCSSARAGSSQASVARVYNYLYRGTIVDQVNARVEYRSPAQSRAFVASFATSHTIRCVRASTAQYYERRYPGKVHVGTTAGLPRWFTRALGRDARGFLVSVTLPPPRKQAPSLHVYFRNFAYQDAIDPHVVYDMIVVQLNSTWRGVAREVIRATG